MNVKNFLIFGLTTILASSCSGTYKAYYQTLEIAFSTQKDIKLTMDEVQISDIDVISVKRGKRAVAIMALAYLENNQHKWVSSDNTMLIMDNGRIKRTLGLNKNLLHLSNTDSDPLKSLPNHSNDKSQLWTRILDLSDDEYGHPIESKFSQASPDTIQALNLDTEAILFIETVKYEAPANYVRINKSWENHFWYSKNGDLIKSIQKVSPFSEPLEITYLSRIARLHN
jgi:hypothetical protein